MLTRESVLRQCVFPVMRSMFGVVAAGADLHPRARPAAAAQCEEEHGQQRERSQQQ